MCLALYYLYFVVMTTSSKQLTDMYFNPYILQKGIHKLTLYYNDRHFVYVGGGESCLSFLTPLSVKRLKFSLVLNSLSTIRDWWLEFQNRLFKIKIVLVHYSSLNTFKACSLCKINRWFGVFLFKRLCSYSVLYS